MPGYLGGILALVTKPIELVCRGQESRFAGSPVASPTAMRTPATSALQVQISSKPRRIAGSSPDGLDFHLCFRQTRVE